MQKRIKLRYAKNEMAVLEQIGDSTTSRIWVSLYELRGIVDYLKNPTEAPYVFYSKSPEPLSVQYKPEDMTYRIERGDTVLCGVRGEPGARREEGAADEPRKKSYAFEMFKKIMSRLARKSKDRGPSVYR